MARVLELDIDLIGATPRVWRRVRVPGDLSLAALHRVIQVLMQWDDVHPYVFDVAGREYGPEPDEDEISWNWAGDDRVVTVGKAAKRGEGHFEYSYDFASERRMSIVVAPETAPASAVARESREEPRRSRPRRIECLDGAGDGFDVQAANSRLADEFRAERPVAGATLTPEEQLIADLTLLLLFLGSWEEGKGTRVAYKTVRFETLDALGDAGLVVTNPHRKSVVLTEEGEKRAQALLQRVTPLVSPSVK